MELKEVLKQLNLNDKESSVYLGILEMGRGSVPSIAKKAGTKRPTTYLVLEELRQKGLVSSIKDSERAIFTAESPQKLLEEQEKKEEIIKESIPELLAIYNTKKEKPKVRYYEGINNIKELYNDIFKSKKIDIYGSFDAIHPEVIQHIEEVIIKKANYHKIRIRELLQSDKKSIEYVNKHKSDKTPSHEIKIASKEYKFPTDNLIYKNKIAILSYKDVPMAVVIESSDVVETYKSMFDITWSSIQENYNYKTKFV